MNRFHRRPATCRRFAATALLFSGCVVTTAARFEVSPEIDTSRRAAVNVLAGVGAGVGMGRHASVELLLSAGATLGPSPGVVLMPTLHFFVRPEGRPFALAISHNAQDVRYQRGLGWSLGQDLDFAAMKVLKERGESVWTLGAMVRDHLARYRCGVAG